MIMFACRDTNKYLTDKAPWALSDVEERKRVLFNKINALL